MFKEQVRNSYLFGIVTGLVICSIAYYTFVNYDEIMGGAGTMRVKLSPPKLQLIILALALVLFRFMMVKWDMIKTGQGLLLTIFIATIVYFLVYRHKFF